MNRAEEIKGGLKNAVSRGENLQKAKQSFINAGYTKEEVEQAEKFLNINQDSPDGKKIPPERNIQEEKPEKIQNQEIKTSIKKTQPLPSSNIQNTQIKKQFPRWLIILLIIFSAVIILGAAIIGLYWNKLF